MITHSPIDEFLALAEETVCRQLLVEHVELKSFNDRLPGSTELVWDEERRALDVGAGTSGAGVRILEGWNYRGVDFAVQVADSLPDVDLQNIQDWHWANARKGTFDLILCKNVLCQMTDAEVTTAVTNMYALLRHGGHLLVCEPWRAERNELCAARPLPDPESGVRGVPLEPFQLASGTGTPGYAAPEQFKPMMQRLADVPVAPDYVLWTRYMWPSAAGALGVWTNRPAEADFLAYDDPRRFIYPAFPAEVRDRFAFYRARLWRKAP